MNNKPRDSAGWPLLAKQCGISRQSLLVWRKLPGAPQTPDKAAWLAFIDENDLGQVGNRVSKDREELMRENLAKRNRLLDMEIAVKNRTMVDRASVDAMLLHVATMQKAVLFPALERELPAKAEGRPAAEISVLGREIGDRICAIFSSGIQSWPQQT